LWDVDVVVFVLDDSNVGRVNVAGRATPVGESTEGCCGLLRAAEGY